MIQDRPLLVDNLTLEAKEMLDLNRDDNREEHEVNVVLTRSNEWIGRTIQKVTGEAYSHVSIGLDRSLDKMYSYDMAVGFTKEDLYSDDFNGLAYTLYKVKITKKMHDELKNRLNDLYQNRSRTKYNYRGLLNAFFKKDIAGNRHKEKMFCSEFVVTTLREAGVDILKQRSASTISPTEIVKTKFLRHVRRGRLPVSPSKNWYSGIPLEDKK